jgi:tetratricopeptide (TPR) repeat protein
VHLHNQYWDIFPFSNRAIILHVRRFFDTEVWVKLLIIFVLAALLGISPRPHQLTLVLVQAQRAIEFNAYHESAALIAQAAGMLPWRGDLWESAGENALKSGEVQSAVIYLKNAAALSYLSLDGYVALAEAYQQAGELETAIQIWQAAIQHGAPQDQIYPRMLEEQLKLKDYLGAIGTLHSLTSLSPADANWHYQLGLLLAVRNPELAATHLLQAAELDHKVSLPARKLADGIQSALWVNDPAYRLLSAGRGLASLEEWELAAEAFRQATLARPNYAEGWAFLGEALQHRKPDSSTVANSSSQPPCGCKEGSAAKNKSVNDESLAALQKALALDPASLSANTFMALYWQRKNNYVQSLSYLERADGLDPGNPAVQAELGNTQALLGDLAAALRNYQQAAKLATNDPTYIKQLVLFSIMYRYQLAEIGLPTAQSAITKFPKDPEFPDLTGQVLLLLEDFQGATSRLLQAIRLDTNYAPAYLHLGQLYLQQGNKPIAQVYLSQAVLLSPATPIADLANQLLQTNFP